MSNPIDEAGDKEAMREVLDGVKDAGDVLEELGRAWAIDINMSGLLSIRHKNGLPASDALPVFSCETELEAWATMVAAGTARAHPSRAREVIIMTPHEAGIGYYVSPNGGYYLSEQAMRRRGVLQVEDLPRVTRALAQRRMAVLERVVEAEALVSLAARQEAMSKHAERWRKLRTAQNYAPA